jgi:hypothetical protein
MKYNFVTLFDSNYQAIGFSMIESLVRFLPEAEIYVIALDEDNGLELSKIFPKVHVINLIDVERYYPELVDVKINRSVVEYYYTLSSVSVNYVFQNYHVDCFLTYLDSDLFFYSSPISIFNELLEKNASIGIISHNFNLIAFRNIKYGKYNVGWVTFKNDENGLNCAKLWMSQCLEWCYQRVEPNRYADQKYLDYWSSTFVGVCEIENLGANVAVWNLGQFSLSIDKKGTLLHRGVPLIFYHFAGLKNLNNDFYDTNLSSSLIFTTSAIRKLIYAPYIESLMKFKSNGTIVPKPDIHVHGFVRKFRSLVINFRKKIFKDVFHVDQFQK